MASYRYPKLSTQNINHQLNFKQMHMNNFHSSTFITIQVSHKSHTHGNDNLCHWNQWFSTIDIFIWLVDQIHVINSNHFIISFCLGPYSLLIYFFHHSLLALGLTPLGPTLYIFLCWPWVLPLLVQHYTFSFVGLGFYPSWSNIIHLHLLALGFTPLGPTLHIYIQEG